MAILLSAVLPIALIALIGVGVGRAFPLDTTTLARVVIYAMLPALVITNLANTTLAWSSAIGIVVALWLNAALLYGLAWSLGRYFQLAADDQKSLIATTIFANVGNMGLPFMLFALGEAGLERAIVYLIGSSLLIASVFPIILKGAGLKAGVAVTLKLPVFWATLVGVGLQLSGQGLPMPIERGLVLLGEGAIPVALVMLGIQLAGTEFQFGRYEFGSAALRLLISPTLAYGVGRVVGLTGLDLQVLVLQAAMPVAVNSLIWVTELGGDRTRVARTIILSTFLSLGTLPIVLWLTTPGS